MFPPQNKPISIIIIPVFSKSSKALNSILKMKQKNRTQTSQNAAVVHKKQKLQTCLKGTKMSTCVGTMVKKPAKLLESILAGVKAQKNSFCLSGSSFHLLENSHKLYRGFHQAMKAKRTRFISFIKLFSLLTKKMTIYEACMYIFFHETVTWRQPTILLTSFLCFIAL